MPEKQTTATVHSANTSDGSETSGFTSVSDLLVKRGYVGFTCVKCRDQGFPVTGEMRYTPLGVPVPSEICDCPAGERLREEIEQAKIAVHEKSVRYHRNKVERLTAQSGIPLLMRDWTLDTYPGASELVTLGRDFVEKAGVDDQGMHKFGLLLLGKSGTAKTGLGVAILHQALECEMPVLFVETTAFLRSIRATFDRNADKTTEEVTRPAREVELLLLDDVGDAGRHGNPASDFARAEIFDLVNHRHNELMQTIFTSNLTAAELASQFGERTWWRIREMCMVIAVTGRNLRA